jgi:hypothetical protein
MWWSLNQAGSNIRHQYEKVITEPHWRKMQLSTALPEGLQYYGIM